MPRTDAPTSRASAHEGGGGGPERAPRLLPWSPVTAWWLFIDAPLPWFAALIGLYLVAAVAFAAAGAWDLALLLAGGAAVLALVRALRMRRLSG